MYVRVPRRVCEATVLRVSFCVRDARDWCDSPSGVARAHRQPGTGATHGAANRHTPWHSTVRETKIGSRIEARFRALFCSMPESVPTRSPKNCRFPQRFGEGGFTKTVASGTIKSCSLKCRLHVYLASAVRWPRG